jgi:hypothetical protein
MTTAIKRRRGTTVQHSTFTGLEGEITVDTTKDTLVVHDGATAGGFPLATEAAVNSKVSLSGNETIAGTKTLSSNPILSAGTANGVPYLNGSKALTSGSALTFDAGASGELALTRGSSAFFKAVESGASVTSYFGSFNGVNWLGTTSNHPITFNVNSVEQMRLTSTGLGIGTSSPGEKLGVAGNIIIKEGANERLYFDTANNATDHAGYVGRNTSDGFLELAAQTLGTGFGLRFLTAGTTRAVIDSSGNLIHQVNGTAPTLATNSTMSFELTSNTSLKIVVRGTDGVTRSVSLTLA